MENTSAPFAGIRVVDLSTTIGGMNAAMLLADLGADVIRFDDRTVDMLPGEVVWQRGKRIVPRAAVLERELITGCDIVVTNEDDAAASLRPLLAGLPRVIHLDLSALVSTAHGPIAYEAMLGADSGAALRQSSFGGGPVELVVPFMSYEQGIWGAAAAAAALVAREQTGRGQHVLVDIRHAAVLTTTTTSVLDPAAAKPSTGVGPSGPSPHYSPYRCGDGQWLFLAALLPKFQRAAFTALGVQILEDPRIAQNGNNMFVRTNLYWVRETLAAAFATKSRSEWLEILAAADVPCSTIDQPEAWLDHPQMVAIGQSIKVDDPRVGEATMPGTPIDFDATPSQPLTPRRFEATAGWLAPALPEAPVTAAEPEAGSGPLAGIRVLDLGTVVAGPLAGRLLAGLGADVVKVETLDGDSFRGTGFQNNLGQRSLAVDLRNPLGREAFLALVGASDVVIDNFRPGVSGRLGIAPADLAAVKPTIISASISGFGGIGPIGMNPGFDPVLQAMSGMMAIQGGDSDPVFHTLAANDVTAAVTVALGTCAALFVRSRRGIGQHLSTSLAAVSAYMMNAEVLQYESRPPVRRGGADHQGPSITSRYYEVSDGWVRLHVADIEQLVDAGLLADDLSEVALETACAALAAADLIERIEKVGGLARKARSVADLANDPSLVEGRYLDEIVRGDGRTLLIPGVHAVFSDNDLERHLRPSGLGEHTREVLMEAGLTDEAIDQLLTDQVIHAGAAMDNFDVSSYR